MPGRLIRSAPTAEWAGGGRRESRVPRQMTATLRRPPSADVVIDTEIESGRHLTFVLVAQHVAPGTQPYEPYVTQVRAARDSLRALAAREGIYYSTVGVVQHWEIAEGLRVLNAYGSFDEVSVGRSSRRTMWSWQKRVRAPLRTVRFWPRP